ncbi:hypothetical protein BED46_040605 [Burkholderia contaminans]|uniref:Uncharacterized protein n=1 Tax=Burkholderia contaminans LMG 23361 TaxID=1334628 RepID=A0ABD4AQP8_9BURK|nr:hypothetical protein WR31_17875 [Burkholderia contaminans LMG 23361]MBA9828323.1 hypothetical protein [Burkholderia contaminans]MBA9836871.1 hypothetical protein [Burkholderia contaminans]MBA9863256.1 hypothetical protein [Burkholderia contaminans]MBA9904011.1 hypothetical protein [Burkholderia contaminans]
MQALFSYRILLSEFSKLNFERTLTLTGVSSLPIEFLRQYLQPSALLLTYNQKRLQSLIARSLLRDDFFELRFERTLEGRYLQHCFARLTQETHIFAIINCVNDQRRSPINRICASHLVVNKIAIHFSIGRPSTKDGTEIVPIILLALRGKTLNQ